MTRASGGSPTLAARLLLWGSAAAWALCLLAVPLTRQAVGRFSGAPIEVRRWMWGYNAAALVAQLAALVPLAAGLWGLRGQPRAGLARWAHRGALGCVAVAALCSLVLLGFPLLFGSGPWPARSTEVSALTALSFLPSVSRAACLALAALGMTRWRALPPRRWHGLLVAAAGADLLISALGWAQVPYAVIIRLHPRGDEPAWLAATTLTVLLLGARLRPLVTGDQKRVPRAAPK